ncbi:protein lethal(2)essential for life-like [Achroia grisella]|uniref:protein lethal(2)essential for life-like n=1 Tax=Achroia grisella TaxID=688607 RepID=UPI0027D2BEB3|nr:protein lethal(2)essential for life-like [Achroia grisella]
MYVCPYYIRNEQPQPRLFNQLGLGLRPKDYVTIVIPQGNQDYYRNWRNLRAARHTGSTIKAEKGKFQINLDVQHFAPEEIAVKTVDGFLVVEANHEEREDEHGFISRRFSRRYPLPEDVDTENITSKLSSDGVLTIIAPPKPPKGEVERLVPIVQTGPIKKQSESNGE